MKWLVALWVLVCLSDVVLLATTPKPDLEAMEKEASEAMRKLEKKTSELIVTSSQVSWNYNTNITDHNKRLKLEAEIEHSKWEREVWNRLQEWKDYWPQFSDESLKRQFKLLSVLGPAALSETEYKEYRETVNEMGNVYSSAKICDFHNSSKCDLSLTPDLTKLLETSRDPDELQHVWEQWRENSGKPIKQLFKKYLVYSQKIADANGFVDRGEMWIENYESKTFRKELGDVMGQLMPLYQQLHAYTRRRLRQVYGQNVVSERGPIPAHLLGNMWSQNWAPIYAILIPYPNKTSIDVTQTMKEQGYTPLRMFEACDEFFASLNLTKVPPQFWKDSMLEKPKDRDVVCHASAWDFGSGKDFRVKMCTEVTMEDFITAHHEMGHIQYYLQYKHLPYIFRDGANGGFHEAVGDILSLSVSTPKHLHKIGLLETLENDDEMDINFLLKMALENVAFMPFSYILDLWRWDLFNGNTAHDNLNCAWWDLRFSKQGIKPPKPRSNDDFDAGAKYHIARGGSYARYMVAHIIKFQFYKSMCTIANEYDPLDPNKPLHRCDIYQSTDAGNALGDMLQMGSSRPWPEAMEALTGQRQMDATVLREYFKPLEDWLQKDNEKHGEFIGWEKDGEYCKDKRSSDVTSGTTASKTSTLTSCTNN